MMTYLAYGAIGLGLSLAILNFHLLRNEQLLNNPRPQMLRAIYAFMCLTLLLTIAGFTSEYLDRSKEIWRLTNNLAEINDTIEGFRKYVSKLETTIKSFDKMRHGLDLLTSVKGDKLSRVNGKTVESDLSSLKADLVSINEAMKRQLNAPSIISE